VVAGFATSPRTPRTGRIQCRATVGRRQLRLVRRGFARRLVLAGPVAVCTWRVPANAAGKTVKGSIVVRTSGATARRAFTRRVAR
jgi:hypothetical protein